ncbi:hypothetical protein GN956_G22747 [Arapaima gigas]
MQGQAGDHAKVRPEFLLVLQKQVMERRQSVETTISRKLAERWCLRTGRGSTAARTRPQRLSFCGTLTVTGDHSLHQKQKV